MHLDLNSRSSSGATLAQPPRTRGSFDAHVDNIQGAEQKKCMYLGTFSYTMPFFSCCAYQDRFSEGFHERTCALATGDDPPLAQVALPHGVSTLAWSRCPSEADGPEREEKSLQDLTVRQLRDECHKVGLKGCSKLKKAELIKRLEGAVKPR